jgi:glycosyltransferase involved in cell wall biosynthesis
MRWCLNTRVKIMRLLSLIPSPVFSGPHNHDLRLSSVLAGEGVSTTILLPEEPGDALARLRSAGAVVITCPSHRPDVPVPRTMVHALYLAKLVRNIRFVRGVIRKQSIDLVQLADPFHLHGAIAARMEGLPVVVHLIGMGGSLPARSMGALITCRLATVIMTAGTGVQAAYPGLSRLRRHVVSYFSPVDVSTFVPNRERRIAARAELGLGAEDVVIGYIARLHPEKDHFTCLRAVSLIRKRFPSVRFVMLGSIDPGCAEYVASLWRTAGAVDLQPGRDVIHRNAGASVAHLAQVFDIYWSTGVQEGATTSIGEAMALALPVVCTDSGSVREMVQDGMTGYVVGSRDFEALARVTIHLIENSALRKQMGRSAREQAVRLFSAEVCAAKHLEAYRTALSYFRSERRGRPRRSGPPPDLGSDCHSMRARMR